MRAPRPKGVLFAWQRAVRDDDSLTSRDKLVAFLCATWMDAHGSGAFPGVTTIAQKCSYASRKPVQKALYSLEEAGYLRIALRPGRTSIYTATFPERLGIPDTHPDDDMGIADTQGCIPGDAPVGYPNDPLPTQVPPHSPSAPAPATSEATPEQALEQLRGLVAEQKTLDAFELPEMARRQAKQRFRVEADRLLRICATEPRLDELVAV